MTILESVLEILNSPVIVSVLTLAVSLTLSYLFAVRRERILKTEERHSDDLKEVAKRWKTELPEIPETETPRFSQPRSLGLAVEQEHIFPDLEKHTPAGLNLFENWRSFKEHYDGYLQKQFELCNDLKNDLAKATGLSVEWGKTSRSMSEHLPEDAHMRLVRLASGRELYIPTHKVEPYDTEGWMVWYANYGCIFIKGQTEADARTAQQAAEDYARFLHQLPRSDYVERLLELREERIAVVESRGEFERNLNDFIAIPVIRGKCKYTESSK